MFHLHRRVGMKNDWGVRMLGYLYVKRFGSKNSPGLEFYMPTFRNILFYLHRRVGMKNYWG
jgi:hypothetical protein